MMKKILLIMTVLFNLNALAAEFEVVSNPLDCDVFVLGPDGKKIALGKTPFKMDMEALKAAHGQSGVVNVTVAKPGFETFNIVVPILTKSSVKINSSLEIEKDITRLQTITDRFSKIGSEPVLERRNIIEDTKNTVDYLQTRVSQQVNFHFEAPQHSIYVDINPALHSWTIENLVKNAIDAMKGKGSLSIVISELEDIVKISITDTGKGIPKNQFTKVFEPGFTTKKRGWGLGLSLTKRIVQEYHKGKIKVAHSEIGKGTTMQISYKTA